MEERPFQNQRMVKRRLMEAKCGGEVRRLHVVYFLTGNGYTQHPHLIRVHRIPRNGVRLRDIKRWLGELRGKDMPESFSWSYKRRYKTGYVWQDLLDDDLITPISDNEYVLKGSEIFSNTNNTDLAYSEKKVPIQEQSPIQESEKDNQKTSFKEDKQSPSSETSTHVSTRSSSEIEESSPTFGSETSSLTDDSRKLEVSNNTVTKEQEKQEASSSLFRSKSTGRTKKVKINEKSISPKAASADKLHFTKSKSCSDGASHMFRNLITCGAVDTNDSAVVKSHKQNRPFLNVCSSHRRDVHSAEMCKRENLGSSQMINGNRKSTQQQWSNSKSCDGVKASAKTGETREQRVPRAAYKPLNGPNCSQCGKSFKPEKLHAHMKSCKGKKSLAKIPRSAISAAQASKISAEFKNQDSASVPFLTY